MICLITGELSSSYYSSAGLRTLSSRLTRLFLESIVQVDSCPSAGEFKVVDRGGLYILKPPHQDYEQLPENEALTMDLARRAGVVVPPFGLLINSDKTYTYFIKRFDRTGRKQKLAVEDFAQLSEASRSTKYRSSLEKVIGVVEQFCTFPLPEKVRLFRRVLVAFLTGNEDMHLKNYSLITVNGKTGLSPAYDLVNTTIALNKPSEEKASKETSSPTDSKVPTWSCLEEKTERLFA